MEINLEISPQYKLVVVNDKEVKVPKLGLRHRMKLAESMDKDHMTILHELLKMIHPNLSVAERDLITLHLLAYNGRIKNKTVIDGHEISVDDAVICQKLKFDHGDYSFKFKSPKLMESLDTIGTMLNENCISAKYKGEPIDFDFWEAPAFVDNWAYDIMRTVSIKVGDSEVTGVYNIVELFYERN